MHGVLENQGTFPKIKSLYQDVAPFLGFLAAKSIAGYWRSELIDSLKNDPLFLGIATSGGKLCFYGSGDELKGVILQVIFPIYIGVAFHGKDVDELSPSLIPLENIRGFIMNKDVQETIGKCRTEVSAAGKDGKTHNRFKILHSDRKMVAEWLWNAFGFLEFVKVGKMVIHEEIGE